MGFNEPLALYSFMAIGQCGSVLGSHIYPKTEGPRYMFVYSAVLRLTCFNPMLGLDAGLRVSVKYYLVNAR